MSIPHMEQAKEVHIMPYSHHDYAWGNSRQWHIRRYLLVYSEVLKAMKANAGFTWLIDNVAHSLLPFVRHCPEQLEELKARVKEGRVAVANGGYSLARSTYVGEETYIRNMVEGKRFFEWLFELGNIEFFYNADVGCGHSQLPQILRLGGHKYYRFQRPDEALDGKKVPFQFVWQGLDGSRILVSRGSYGGFVDGRYANMDFRTEWNEAKRQFIAQELSGKVGALQRADIVWLNAGGDDTRPFRNLYDEPIRLGEFVEAWNEREETKLLFSTPTAYFGKLERMSLPVHVGVLDPCELSYNAPIRGDHAMWRMRSELDRLLVKAESLATFACLAGALLYPEDELRKLWLQLFDITGHAIEWIDREDFDRLHAVAVGARCAAASLIGEACSAIASRIEGDGDSQYVLLNAMSWRRKEMVELHIADPEGVGGFDLYDADGKKVDYQVVNTRVEHKNYAGCEYSAVDIVAEADVPAMGYACFTAVRNGTRLADKAKADRFDPSGTGKGAGSDCGAAVVDNGVLEVAFERGAVVGIKESASGRIIQAGRSSAISGLKFVQTEATEAWISSWEPAGECRVIPETWEWVEYGPLRWVYRVQGSLGDSRYRLDAIVHRGERAIAFDLELESIGDTCGYFAVDFASDPDTYLYADIPFGVEERNLTDEVYGGIPGSESGHNAIERGWKGQFYAKNWALFQNGGMPMAIVSENGSIYYKHDNSKQTVTFLLNRRMPAGNRKGTHPSLDGKGLHRFKYDLVFPESKERFADIVKFSKGKSQPIEAIAKYHRASAQGLPRTRSFADIDYGHVVVSACYVEDGNVIMRLYETEGKSGELRVRLGFPFASARLTDFLGNELDPPVQVGRINEDSISLTAAPWQIINLQFTLTGDDPNDSAATIAL